MERRHQDGSQLLGPCVWLVDSGAITGVRKMGGWGVLNKEVFFDHVDFEACVRHAGRDI